jgi:D-glycero-D-manno-heptose 1,7-bisphosphate phosphatase
MSNKAVFMDRDNTLIEDPGYINNPDQVKLLPGASEAIVELKEVGYKRVIVTNQSAVARGIVTEKVLGRIHERLEKLLAQEGAYIDKIYYCPYHPDGVIEKYRKDSDLRKPNCGMILAAAGEMDIDLGQSWMIGNSYRDITAGLRAGCKTILINSSINQTYRKPTDPVPDKQAVNIKEAVNIIKMHDRQSKISSKAVPRPQTPESPFKVEELFEQKQTEQQLPAQPKPQAWPPDIHMEVKHEEPIGAERTNELLEEILRHIKQVQRENMFEEFSVVKVTAIVIQCFVFFCLLMGIWYLIDHTRSASSVHTMIGFAILLQLMVITLCLIRDRK